VVHVNFKGTGATIALIDQYLMGLRNILEELPVEKIIRVVALIEGARLSGNTVFIFGNGGSAATASHFAADLSKGAICNGKPRIKALSLTDNTALICAWANDTSYENVFAQQLENLIKPNDLVIAISGSGNSQNVISAIELAKLKGAITIGFLGFDGGQLAHIVDVDVTVSCDNMERVEDIHLILQHIITTCLRRGIC
jgi:D-sedoheptulose 7-phosphate isomerase